MRRRTTIIRWRNERHISAAFICASVPFRLASGRWCIRDWSLDNILKSIVSCSLFGSTSKLLSFSISRRFKLFDFYDGIDTGGPNDVVDHSNAIHLSQHNRFGYGATQSYITFWPNAYGGHESVRMVVRAGRRDETWNSSFAPRFVGGSCDIQLPWVSRLLVSISLNRSFFTLLSPEQIMWFNR